MFVSPLSQVRRKLWCDFVKNIERILHRHAPHLTESSFCAQLTHFRLCYSSGTKTFAMVRKRRGHAVKYATTVEESSEQTLVLLQLVRAVDFQAYITPLRPQS